MRTYPWWSFGFRRRLISRFTRLERFASGYKKSSTLGSNNRRFISRTAILIICLCLFAIHGLADSGFQTVAGRFLAFSIAAFAVSFFILVVLAIPFLTSQNFQPDPIRLLKDTLISIVLSIVSFTQLFLAFGIRGPSQDSSIEVWDYLYFSAVTFSTLGYGDFSPTPESRMIAAFEALLGNLHLGMIVGAAYFATQQLSGKQSNDDTD